MGLFSKNGSTAVAAPPAKPKGLTSTGPVTAPKAPASSAPAASPVAAPPPQQLQSVSAKQLAAAARNVPVPAAPLAAPQPERSPYFQKMKVRIHQQLVERLDVQNLKTLPP